MNDRNDVNKSIILFLVGALLYFECELNWRYFAGTLPVHFSMPLVGGAMFVIIGLLNEYLEWDIPIETQALIGCIAVTIVRS